MQTVDGSRALQDELNVVIEMLADQKPGPGLVYQRYKQGQLSHEDVARALSQERTGHFDNEVVYDLLFGVIEEQVNVPAYAAMLRGMKPGKQKVAV